MNSLSFSATPHNVLLCLIKSEHLNSWYYHPSGYFFPNNLCISYIFDLAMAIVSPCNPFLGSMFLGVLSSGTHGGQAALVCRLSCAAPIAAVDFLTDSKVFLGQFLPQCIKWICFYESYWLIHWSIWFYFSKFANHLCWLFSLS